MARLPLAHSAPAPDRAPDLYRDHVAGRPGREGVVRGAVRRADAATGFATDPALSEAVRHAVRDAATFHDLGKLDRDVQAGLAKGRGARLDWDHVDAGVAHLSAAGAGTAAWLVRAHHAPGLPSGPGHFTNATDRRLRGRRRDDDALARHRAQIERTDGDLPALLAAHEAAVGQHASTPGPALHGLPLRLALSCLVDADHADTAFFDGGWTEPVAPAPRWPERLARLDAHVAALATGGGRDALRSAFYEACRHRGPDAALLACEGPVGIGKTTAVTAFLIARAIATGARRLIVVAPYTAILSQTAAVLRTALVLPGEDPEAVVAEHHHRADFEQPSSRDLATLWAAPVILTTAVQFFETLAGADPSGLRKLHALPGSVVFLDEAHAALPLRLWPQNWRWIRSLATEWSCSFVLASGSLARFWELDAVVGDERATLPDLVPAALAPPLRDAEAARVRFVSDGYQGGPKPLIAAVLKAPGPRLVVMNTVGSAAALAHRMKEVVGPTGKPADVMHISTALSPDDRATVLAEIRRRLDPRTDPPYPADWTLVATSLMEAGVDVSFRSAFRERFAASSLIQIGGRANRHASAGEPATVHDFVVASGDGLTGHPAAKIPGDVLADLFDEGRLDGAFDAARLVTLAMNREAKRDAEAGPNPLGRAEAERRYPCVQKHGRVIDADTRLVVVDPALKARLEARLPVPARELLGGSVQIWSNKIGDLGLSTIAGRDDVHWWPHAYEPDGLGYMKGVLFLDSVRSGEAVIF